MQQLTATTATKMDLLGYASGITSLLIVMLGIVLMIIMLNKYYKTKDDSTLMLALFFMGCGCVWLGIVCNFISYLVGAQFLERDIYFYSFAWSLALIMVSLVFILSNLIEFNRIDLIKLVKLFSIILALAYLICIYLFIPLNLTNVNDFLITQYYTDSLPDSSVAGYMKIFVAIMIIMVLVIAFTFISTGRHSFDNLAKYKMYCIGFGMALFSVLTVFDGLISGLNVLLLIIIRLLVISSLLLIYIGISTKILQKYIDYNRTKNKQEMVA